jgi:hypothetical protein
MHQQPVIVYPCEGHRECVFVPVLFSHAPRQQPLSFCCELLYMELNMDTVSWVGIRKGAGR